jgi:hypothetical protein
MTGALPWQGEGVKRWRTRQDSTCGEAQPSSHGARCFEVGWVFNSGNERSRSNGTDPWDRHQQLALLAVSSACEKLPTELSGTDELRELRLQQWQNDACERFLVDKQSMDMFNEAPAACCRNDQTERLHETADLVGKFRRDPDQPRSHCDPPSSLRHRITSPRIR